LNLRRPVPLWLFLVGLLLVGSVAAGLTFLPPLLTSKPDFTVDLSPAQQTVITEPGQSSSSWVNIRSLHGFIGKVSLSAEAPNGVTVSFNGGAGSSWEVLLGSDNALLGLNATAFIDMSTPTIGNYSVSVVGASGSLSHAATLRLVAQDLVVCLSPSSIVLPQGSTVVSGLSLTSLNGFAGNVSLAATSNLSWGYVSDDFVKASISPGTIIVPSPTSVSRNVVVSDGDFARLVNGTVSVAVSIASESWLRTQNVQIIQPPESLGFPSSKLNSPSNATLWIRNNGPAAVKIISYNVTDSLGSAYFWCLSGPLLCNFPVVINATLVGALELDVGNICYVSGGECKNYGSQFTFQTGHSYTVTVQTSRNHYFTTTIGF
jgi:hypothetical protein